MGGRGGGSSLASKSAAPSAAPAAAPAAAPDNLDSQILTNYSRFLGEGIRKNLASVENVKAAFPDVSGEAINDALKRLQRAGRINMVEDPNPSQARPGQIKAGFRLGGQLVSLFHLQG